MPAPSCTSAANHSPLAVRVSAVRGLACPLSVRRAVNQEVRLKGCHVAVEPGVIGASRQPGVQKSEAGWLFCEKGIL